MRQGIQCSNWISLLVAISGTLFIILSFVLTTFTTINTDWGYPKWLQGSKFSGKPPNCCSVQLQAQLIGTCYQCRCVVEAIEQDFENWAFEELTERVMEIRAERDLIVLCNSSLEDWYETVFYSLFSHIFSYLKFEWLKQKGF